MDQHTTEATDQLLGAGDIPPVHEVNPQATSPFLLTADHYGGCCRARSATSASLRPR